MNKSNLQKRILVSFLTLPFLTIVAIIIFSAFQIINREIQVKKNLAESVSINFIDKLDRNFFERYGDVQAFSAVKIAQEASESEEKRLNAVDFMNTMTQIYVLYDYMLLTDIKGRVIAVNNVNKNNEPIDTKFLLEQNFSKTDWFKDCFKENKSNYTWYSNFKFDKFSQRIYNNLGDGMAFASPVISKDGNFKGVWYNFASWDDITGQIRKETELKLNQKYPNSKIILTTDSDQLISSNDSKQVVEGGALYEQNDKLFLKIGNKTTNLSDEYVIGKATSSGAYSYIGKEWKSYVLLNKGSGIMSIIFQHLVGIIILAIICCIITVYVGIKISTTLANKILKIKNTVQDLALGKLLKVETEGND